LDIHKKGHRDARVSMKWTTNISKDQIFHFLLLEGKLVWIHTKKRTMLKIPLRLRIKPSRYEIFNTQNALVRRTDHTVLILLRGRMGDQNVYWKMLSKGISQ